jgi:hypothetical protein
MPKPSNPTNNQTYVLNGILYTYNSAKGAWTVTTNSEASYNMSSITASGLVTAANIRTTAGVFWSNGVSALTGAAGGSTNSIQYNSSNTFAGATNFTYTAQSGNVVIGATTATSSTTTGALVVGGGIGVAGQGVFGGNLTVGNMNQTRANLLVFGGNLNAGVGSSIALAEFYATNTNGSYLRIVNNRHAQGADWTSANTRIQQMIDVTPQGYIEFNPVGATYGVAIGSGTTEIMRLASSGNVVINATTASTSTTTGALVVKGGVGVAGNIIANNTVSAGSMSFTSNYAGTYYSITHGVGVGIGTLGTGYGTPASPTAYMVVGVGGGKNYITNNGNRDFYIENTAGLDALYITDANGNVILNSTTTSTSTTTGALVVAGGAGIAGNVTAANVVITTGIFYSNGAAFTSGGVAAGTTGAFQYNSSNTFAAANVTFTSANGNVVINSTTTTTSTTTGALVVKGGIGAAGNIYIGGSGYFVGNVFSSYSDIRLKTILGRINNGLDKISSIETFYYEPSALAVSLGVDPGHRQIGVSAQSVQLVAPEAVGPSPLNSEYLTVQYERLIPLLIEAIKELKTEFKELKNQLGSK